MATHTGMLPAGLTESDLPFGGSDSLLDYTPPNVQWQAPLAQAGSNVFANYVKSYPDLLRTYNRRLSRPEGTFEALPFESGLPQSMGSWGQAHYTNYGQPAGRELYNPLGLWSDPGRSPYVGYGGLPGVFAPVASTGGDGDDETPTPFVPSTVLDWNLGDDTGGGGGGGGDDQQFQGGQTPQQIVQKAIEDDPSLGIHPGINTGQGIPTDTEYPSGHNTYQGWFMDPTNQFGHYWSLSMGNPSLKWDFGQGRYTQNGTPVY